MPCNTFYPFSEADSGESFTIMVKNNVEIRRVQNAASAHKRRHPGFDYKTRCFETANIKLGAQTFIEVTVLNQPN
jgi:hypothetical protein